MTEPLQSDVEPVDPAPTAGARVAGLLEREVVRAGWPVGRVLGAEVELCERFGVGRGVIREAARILEVRGVAHRRRGPGGGLVVGEPDPARIAGSFEAFLQFRGVTVRQLLDIWQALESLAVADLAETIDEEGVRRLRAAVSGTPPEIGNVAVADLHDVHTDIAELCSNPAVGIFLQIVVALCRARGHEQIDARAVNWLHATMTRLVEAIVAGDGARAQFVARRYIERLREIGAFPEDA
jgi:DNA-binding FadR family transcriptional regulator